MILDNETYEKLVNENEKYIVKFSTNWCGPCKTYAPVFEEFSNKSEIKCFSVDCDKNLELAGMFNVMTIPTTLLMQGDKTLNKKSGYMTLEQLEDFAN